MKQIGLFLIFLLAPLVLSESVAQVADSLRLFENITDIEKLIQQGATRNRAEDAVLPTNQQPPVIRRQDTATAYPRVRRSIIIPPDSLYRRKANGMLQLPDYPSDPTQLIGLTFKDTIFYNPLFLPMIFTGKTLPANLSFYPKKGDNPKKGLLIPQEETFAPYLKHNDFVNEVRREFYRNYPDRVSFSVLQFESLPTTSKDKEVAESFDPFRKLISAETNYSLEAPSVDGVKIRRKYWVKNGEHSLQFSQSYFSPNWYKGGTSNFNVINNHILRFDYQKDKVKFNNVIEWRLAVFTTPEDTVRKFGIGDDLIRYFGDFGIDAFIKKWAYSANIEVKSQMFNNYTQNSTEILSAFLAPLYANGGIGLKYNLDKKSEDVRHRRVRLSIHFDPIGFSLRYVGNANVPPTRYGIDDGRRSKIDFGSTVTANLIYDFSRYFTWNSRFRYFSSYNKVETEFENTLNMAVTNAFSTRFFLFMRYDDSVPPDARFKHLQITQMLSFGLNYKW